MTNLPKKDGEETLDINQNDSNVRIFVSASQKKIGDVLQSMYVQCNRDEARMFATLAKMLGREIDVRNDYNASSPYVELANGTLSLYFKDLYEVTAEEIVRYKQLVQTLIKPKLVEFAKKLDRMAQDGILENAREALGNLEQSRNAMSGIDFDPLDERLTGILVEPEAEVEGGVGDVRDLLRDVFVKEN